MVLIAIVGRLAFEKRRKAFLAREFDFMAATERRINLKQQLLVAKEEQKTFSAQVKDRSRTAT